MYSALRRKNGYTCRSFAELMRKEFPAANASGISLAERPEESGVTYTADARRFIKETFKIGKKQENRKDSAHLTCWLPEAVKDAFLRAKVKRGFMKDKDYMIFLIMQDVAMIERAARSGGTEQGGEEKYINNIISETEELSNDCRG